MPELWLVSSSGADFYVCEKLLRRSLPTGPCEFGAEQAILVPTDAAKRKLVARVGTRALVFAVLEGKGLEFRVTVGNDTTYIIKAFIFYGF